MEEINTKPNQRIGSKSNADIGRQFEKTAFEYFNNQGIHLDFDFALNIGIAERKKAHRFDLGSSKEKIIIECKSHTWTVEGNVPSAKMTVWNEAMYYFSLVPSGYRKILFVLRSYNEKKKETLADYYARTYDHLIPGGVEIIEFDDSKRVVTLNYSETLKREEVNGHK